MLWKKPDLSLVYVYEHGVPLVYSYPLLHHFHSQPRGYGCLISLFAKVPFPFPFLFQHNTSQHIKQLPFLPYTDSYTKLRFFWW